MTVESIKLEVLDTISTTTTQPEDSTRANSPDEKDICKKDKLELDIEERDVVVPLDIEHMIVDDDPRLWSNGRKTAILA